MPALCTIIVNVRYLGEDATTYLHVLLKYNNISSLKPPNPVSMEYNKHRLCLYQGVGLGNDIFQYASMYTIVKSKGMIFVVPTDLDLLKIFKLNVTDIYHSGYLIFDPSHLCSSLDRIWTHTIDTLQNKSLSLMFSALDHSTISAPYEWIFNNRSVALSLKENKEVDIRHVSKRV